MNVEELADYTALKCGEYYEKGFLEGIQFCVKKVKELNDKGYETQSVLDALESLGFEIIINSKK